MRRRTGGCRSTPWLCSAGPAAALALIAAASSAAAAPAAEPDTTLTVRAPVSRKVNFDVVDRDDYLRHHAYSLDHFLEFEPGGFLVRLGPIGNDGFYSRWGIGRGRAQLVMNGVPLNDPQNDVAPLVHTATSGLSSMSLAESGRTSDYAPWIEGSVVIDELEAPASRPNTFIELSKGTNELRQRRVRFTSQQGIIGLDLSYDELLDNGYQFNAAGRPGDATNDYGRSRSRNGGIAVRGRLGDGARYGLGIRRYRSSTTGDLGSGTVEADRSGHLAWVNVGVGSADATLYGRGYSSTYPDSATMNETTGGVIAWSTGSGTDRSLSVRALAEHTNATQDVGGEFADNDATRALLSVATEMSTGAATMWSASASAGADEQSPAWGAGLGVEQRIPHGTVSLTGRRGFRLPSLGERYLPVHDRDGRTLAGDAGLDPESAWEAGGDWVLRAGPFTNRVRTVRMRASDTIAFRGVDGDSLMRVASNATDVSAMTFVEERAGLVSSWGRIEIRADAAGLFSDGDRTGAFASVPRSQVNASFRAGSELFNKSSALYAGIEYTYVDGRADYDGNPLSSFGVMNFSLVGRLIDAHLYLRLLNALDETYQTQAGYLMTPYSLVYGIEWTLFD